MKIEKQNKNCRYWGYEPASGEKKDALLTLGLKRCTQLREQYRQECKDIKLAGYKATVFGLNRSSAIDAATALEKRMNIEMRVFSHDYL